MKKPTLLVLATILLLAAITAAQTDSFLRNLTLSGQLTSTVSTGTAPLVVASTTQVTNLNAQLHGGLAAPASAIVGLTDTQALQNKTFDISLNTSRTAPTRRATIPGTAERSTLTLPSRAATFQRSILPARAMVA